MKQKKSALINSLISLLLCFSMLVGTTFAWFTDSVTTGINTIAAGNLDVELYHSNAAVKDERVSSSTKLFMDLQGEPILWEPGVVSYENLRVTNAGDLALAYRLAINTANENYVVEESGAQYGLSQILKVGVVEGGITASERTDVVASVDAANWTTLADFMRSGSLLPEGAGESEKTWGVVIYWEPGENDNLWNLNNGKKLSSGEVLTIELGVNVVATQEQYESDAFGDDYDTNAKADVFPDFVGGSASANVTPDANNLTSAQVQMSSGQVAAVVPAGVKLAEGTTQLQLTVAEMNGSGANIVLGENEALRSLDVHIDGVAEDNTVPMTITIEEAAPIGLNMGNYKLYHVEGDGTKEMTLIDSNADFTAHNQFKYDPATGDIILYMATFSEVAVVADTENAWNGDIATAFAGGSGTEASPYLIANADQLAYFGEQVGNGTTYANSHVNLIADINLGYGVENHTYTIFYPIGYYNSEGTYTKTGNAITSDLNSFEGTFDGQGHSISNIYQNTWEMKGDNPHYAATEQYYNDGMGLFGYVNGGTVKNLTVDNFSSDGEFTPTGVIAAYADGNATFANIAITNCNPRVYNTGNGGIIGIAGKSSGGDSITLQNITVDNSNKISALWGSWDVACGGLVGMFRGNDKGSTISFNNCHVAAQIDVYNDVCANYQYYAYRYAGMIIGSVRNNTTTADGKSIPNMAGISATGCTVNYGDWNDYYYCEFEKNTMASYSEDYQFSRVPHSELNFTDSNGNGVVDANERASVTGCKHTHTAEENHQAIYLPFNQLFTGYGWGVNSVGLKEYGGIYIEGVSLGDQEESVEKFETKFTGDFLYRVGNQNTVSVGSLFAAAPKLDENGGRQYDDGGNLICWDINDEGTYVRIDKLYEDADVTCTFTANTTDWTKGTLKFTGTGVVDIVIQDYDYCTPTVLKLEVVDAVNATTATSATANNVVLLNDCGFSTLEVSSGYTLYGNGFTMTCSSDSASLSFGQFVELDSGTLDNVQIVCPNYDYAALYNSQLKDTDSNRSETTNGTTRYYNAKSAVLATGNSQILNSRISGGRAALYASNGNIVVDNSRLEGGAVATTIISGANSFVFRDATLIQKPTVSTYDSAKTLMGMSVLYLCDADGSATPTLLEGSFVQNAWADSSCTSYMPTGTNTIAQTVLGMSDYTHTVNGKTCVNLGFAYMPSDGTTVAQPNNIDDQRTDKETIPYSYASVNASVPVSGLNVNISTYVYTYGNGSGTNDGFTGDSEYTPDEYSDIITLTYSDDTDGLAFDRSYGIEGWVYELNVDLDKASGYALDFSKVTMSVNGISVDDFMVDGASKPSTAIAVSAGGVSYTLSATVNGKEYSAVLKVTGVETSKDAPSLVDSKGNKIELTEIENKVLWGEGLCVEKSSYSSDYTGAAPVLEGISIKYWSVEQSDYVTIALADLTPDQAGKVNDANDYWSISGSNNDFTLTVTNTNEIHSGNHIKGMPVVYNKKLYFIINSTDGFVSSGSGARQITMKYSFADNNGGKLEFNHTWEIGYEDTNIYYDDVCGNESSDECVTGDTLVTLSDGTQKEIRYVTYEDELLVWDFYNGTYTKVPASIIWNHGEADYDVTSLYFNDGTVVEMINSHGFFEVESNNFVYLTEDNVKEHIGHSFIKVDGNSYTTVKLIDYSVERKYTGCYSMQSAIYNNFVVENMFSMTTPDYEGWFDYFNINDDMKYDEKHMQEEIAKYGLCTYDEISYLGTYEQYVALNAQYLKILIGRGIVTMDEVITMLQKIS